MEGKLSIRYFSKRNSLILTINTWPDVPKSSIRFPEWNIFLCSEPSRQNNGKKHLHPSPSADLVVSLSQLSQMLIPIFYLLLENRTKKSQKFAFQIRFFHVVSNMIILYCCTTRMNPKKFLNFHFQAEFVIFWGKFEFLRIPRMDHPVYDF